MSARERILAALRASRGPLPEAVAADSGGAPADGAGDGFPPGAPVGPRPAIPAASAAERVAAFCARAEAAGCRVARLPDPVALPAAVAEALRGRNLPAAIRMGADPVLAALDWSGLEASVGCGRREEPATLSRAAFGVAETGSLVFLSGPDNPVTLTFLGDHHLVLLREADVVAHFEAVWAGLRDAGADPRTVNLVTGPSRSADIEQKLEMGAHGPVSVTVFLTGAGADPA